MSEKLYYKTKVLIVDDTSFMRNNLAKILVELGFTAGLIHQAENGKDGLFTLEESEKEGIKNFDLIFCDWNMPKMNGIELLKAVRASKSYFKNLPFILVTTDSEKEKVIEAVQYKVSGYIIKPVEKETIEHALESIDL
ncbi:MAG: response regulator [Halobacteriovorax sp.]|nr:response regulator [Halobacteriovorax sp.]|tara:strand:- start:443 stop:856 length:414 start_codon:yes stop_codon:yes gene_type:complete